MIIIENNNLLIIQYPPKYPLSVHLYITNQCNLDCKKCHYRTVGDEKKELTIETIKELFLEWKKFKLTSIAIGGGEPNLHPNIEEIINFGKHLGFFMAVTTNGTILKPIYADRVHISYDKIHPTWKKVDLIQGAINYYKNLGCKVGINHIVTSIEDLKYLEENLTDFDNILLIKEKPDTLFTSWNEIERKSHYWLDACRTGLKCEQGVLSFHLNYDMQSSICSNLKKRISYTTLEETWIKLKSFKCEIRDRNKKNPPNHYNALSIKHEIHSKDTIDGSTTPIPLEPDPESTEILIEMFELVMESPLLSCIKHMLLLINDKKTGKELRFEYTEFSKEYERIKAPFKLPEGKDGARQMIKIIRALIGKDKDNLPNVLHKVEEFDFEMYLYMHWKDFDDCVDFSIKLKTKNIDSNLEPKLVKRRLKFAYYGDSVYQYNNVRDKDGNIDYCSERFMNLFRPIRELFHERWPDKYFLMPVEKEAEKIKLIREIKKRKPEKFDETNYKKMDDFFK